MSKKDRDDRTTEYAQGLANIVLEFETKLNAYGQKTADATEQHILDLLRAGRRDHESQLDAIHMAVDADIAQRMTEGLMMLVKRTYPVLLRVSVNAAIDKMREQIGRDLTDEALGTEEEEDDVGETVVVRFIQEGGDA